MLDSRYRIGNALQCRRNGNDFLNAATKTFNVIVPVENFTDIKISRGIVFEPLFEVVALDTWFGLENGKWYRSFRYGGTLS